jgi:hypothetical protein
MWSAIAPEMEKTDEIFTRIRFKIANHETHFFGTYIKDINSVSKASDSEGIKWVA